MAPYPLALALLSFIPPPPCPWTYDVVDSLVPNGATVPVNASFWLRSYGLTKSFAIEDGDGTAIDFDRFDMDLVSTGGTLIELRPREHLLPGRSYSLRRLDMEADALVEVTTSSTSDPDRTPPEAPEITAVQPIGSPWTLCPTAGVIIDIAPPDEPVIHLIRDPSGDVLEIGASASINPNRTVPTPPNEVIQFEVVALDLAGNRSDRSPLTDATAGPVPDPRISREPANPFEDPEGCSCTSHPAGSASWLALLAIALTRAVRRSLCDAFRLRRGASSSPRRARDLS